MPDESNATDWPTSPPVSPKLLAHTRSPAESNFETNRSLAVPPPAEVNSVVPAPGSKSTVFRNPPVVYTLPDESTATE